ncbi:hypothetical protein JOC36_000737 [Weissella uvarum]|uniref:hypothetical protein n=1 Tax=Weissella uvarum TaxID=1479233 RepID=UPI001961A518|nr:hypothetical protein [Weissella uvarum]MBM7617188.1 hypothetical protein [Weissella uvarum]MCM0595482.1 hypothetical protein [Weissella uvarum]
MTEFANTTPYSNVNGAIATGIYTDAEIEKLTAIAHGTEYNGNTNFDGVYTDGVYVNGTSPYLNLVGADGVLKLYNQSAYLPKAAQSAVAGFWNAIAGTEIVRFVDNVADSDEVIHDVAGDTGVLGAQTYDGRGLIFYPDAWHTSNLTPTQEETWHISLFLHEIGHALGIPHLGGGVDGVNAGNASRFGDELMGPWTVTKHPEGIKSTLVDAAALAVAALTWRKPRRIADWVLNDGNKLARALYNNRQVMLTIPKKLTQAEKWQDWSTVKTYSLENDYFDRPITISIQSGIVVITVTGYLKKDLNAEDIVVANTRNLTGLSLPTNDMRGTIVDVTEPESKGGVVGLTGWRPNGDIFLNLNMEYKKTLNHYLSGSVTAASTAKLI